MNSSNFDLTNLIHRFLDGQLSDSEVTRLEARLRTDQDAADLYLELADLHACLAEDLESWSPLPQRSLGLARTVRGSQTWFPRVRIAAFVSAICIVVMAAIWWTRDSSIATIGELHACQWVSPTTRLKTGDPLRVRQRVELSSGAAVLNFECGATVKLIGPAILEPLSANSALLLLGQVAVAAETPRSKGFVVQTRTATMVDIGTRFIAAVSSDGQSRVDVSTGKVDVSLEGIAAIQHLTEGDSLFVEPGERQIMTRIESGDSTPAFRFPTIEPPSNSDYADQSKGFATIRVVRGKLYEHPLTRSGDPIVLFDGRGQSHMDSDGESVFFHENMGGRLLMDLGRPVSLAKINTYSWHQHPVNLTHRCRAVQRYTLYGFAGDIAPNTDDVPTEAGWVQIARINTDDFFHVTQDIERPPQQACSITAARDNIGRYRYLLWDVEPSKSDYVAMVNTMYGEVDIYATEMP